MCWTNKSDPRRPTTQPARLEGSATYVLVPDTAGQIQRSYGDMFAALHDISQLILLLWMFSVYIKQRLWDFGIYHFFYI